MAFTKRYHDALAAWRKAQPEYAAMMNALKRNAPNEEVFELSDDCGVFIHEVSELQGLRRRASAPEVQKRAARFTAAEKEVAQLVEQIAEIERKMALSKTRLAESELENRLYDVVETRQKAQLSLADARLAAACVAAARAEGVL